jgi:hypothetical protein
MRSAWFFLLLACATHGDWLLRTAAQEDAPPRYIPTQDGRPAQAKGLCVDILRAIERTDPQIRFSGEQAMPLTRILKLLEANQLDAFACLTRNDERQGIYQYVDVPLFEVNYRMAVNRQDPISVASFDEIRALGKDGIILANRGTGTLKFLERQPGLQVDASGIDQHENLRKLIAGIGRFYYRHDLGLEAEIAESGLADSVRLLPAVFSKQKQYLVLSPHASVDLMQRLKLDLERLRDSGELARIRARY